MQIEIKVTRSMDWVHAQRLETGENIPERVVSICDISKLSLPTREILLEIGSGQYPTRFNGYFNESYKWSQHSYYGNQPIVVNLPEHLIGEKEVDAAFLAADAKLKAQREEKEVKEREEKEAARKLEEAKELLKNDIEKYKSSIEQCKSDIYWVCEVISQIPNNEIVKALEKLLKPEVSIKEMKNKLELISPVYIFGEDDDED